MAGRRFGDVEVQRAGESRRVDEMELEPDVRFNVIRSVADDTPRSVNGIDSSDTPRCEWVRLTKTSKTRSKKTPTPRFRRNWMWVEGVQLNSEGPHPPRFRRFSTVSASSMASTTKKSWDTLRFRVVNGRGQGDSTVHRPARQISWLTHPPFSSCNETSRRMTPPIFEL